VNASKGAVLAAVTAAAIAAGAGAASPAPTETLSPLLRQIIPNIPGKSLTAVEVDFPPGARSSAHRHGEALLYAYVLAGEIRSQIEGEPPRSYGVGDSWTEKPGDHHVVTENVSATEPARLLVVFIANTGDALKTDDPGKDP
jgi:quercetin dioxygenase-like cupin family protein